MRGGGHIEFHVTSGAPNVPQNELDKALVQAVWHNVDKQRRASFTHGNTQIGFVLADIRRIANDCGRDLQNPFRVLTPKQRACLLKWCPAKDRDKFAHLGAPPIPEVLKNLPLKPPTRKRDPDEESDE